MDELLAQVIARWRELEPLLPAPSLPVGGPQLTVPGAVAAPRRLSRQPGEPLPMWFAAHRFTPPPAGRRSGCRRCAGASDVASDARHPGLHQDRPTPMAS
jgi:hypothetical protein